MPRAGSGVRCHPHLRRLVAKKQGSLKLRRDEIPRRPRASTQRDPPAGREGEGVGGAPCSESSFRHRGDELEVKGDGGGRPGSRREEHRRGRSSGREGRRRGRRHIGGRGGRRSAGHGGREAAGGGTEGERRKREREREWRRPEGIFLGCLWCMRGDCWSPLILPP
jgi:hypothetical protein